MVSQTLQKSLEKILINLLKSNLFSAKSYLAGGTAIYFHLKHRLSIDLDFFTQEKFNSEIILINIKELFNKVKIEILEDNTLILYLTKDKIKFSLFYYPYPLLSDLYQATLSNKVKCPIASLIDIEAMKMIAIAQRGSAKDFVDLYYLLKKTKHTFNNAFSLVKKKYKIENDYKYHLKTSLIFFDDAEKELKDIFLLNPQKQNLQILSFQLWNKIKNQFKEFIK